MSPNLSILGQLSAIASISLPQADRSRVAKPRRGRPLGALRTARATQILAYLAANQPAGRNAIAKHVGCKPDTLTHTLRVMAEAKQVRRIGICKGARWALYGWTDHKARMAA